MDFSIIVTYTIRHPDEIFLEIRTGALWLATSTPTTSNISHLRGEWRLRWLSRKTLRTQLKVRAHAYLSLTNRAGDGLGSCICSAGQPGRPLVGIVGGIYVLGTNSIYSTDMKAKKTSP